MYNRFKCCVQANFLNPCSQAGFAKQPLRRIFAGFIGPAAALTKITAACPVVFPYRYTMQTTLPKFADKFFPREYREVFDSRVGVPELRYVGVEILVVEVFYYLVVNYTFEIADTKILIFGRLYGYLNDIVMAVTCGICAPAENFQIATFAEPRVP